MRGARSAGPSIRISGKVIRPDAPRSAILGAPVLLSGAKGPTGIGAITPPIPREKVAPPVTGLVFHPRGRKSLSRCAVVSSGSGPQGCPCAPARTKVPRPAKPRGFHPPTYAPRHPQRVHRGSPFSSTPYGALGHGPGVVQGGQAHSFTHSRARPLSGGLPGRRSGTPPAQAPPPHPATDRSGSVPSWVKSKRRMAGIGILSTAIYSLSVIPPSLRLH